MGISVFSFLESRRLDYEAKVRSRWEAPPQQAGPQASNANPTTTTTKAPNTSSMPKATSSNNISNNVSKTNSNTPSNNTPKQVMSPTSTEFNDSTVPAGVITSPSKSPQKESFRMDPATRIWAAGL